MLTPVGAMLLGLAEGESIEWVSEDGPHRIALDAVKSPIPLAH